MGAGNSPSELARGEAKAHRLKPPVGFKKPKVELQSHMIYFALQDQRAKEQQAALPSTFEQIHLLLSRPFCASRRRIGGGTVGWRGGGSGVCL